MARNLDPEKLAKLHDTSAILDRKYGERGTLTRSGFEENAYSAYYSEILRERRKELKITQQQLADKIGKERSYIAHIERGETDMQLSSFIKISNALGLNVSLIQSTMQA
ncbi:MAG: helix-turn-helix transcriptional regulator [Tannerellaceae bacterium]|jgi:DNA-binding XRE family transcriptional regulator|nr:helix-turn-helix transcriptional regulator [Tannerellaceae bacterium]